MKNFAILSSFVFISAASAVAQEKKEIISESKTPNQEVQATDFKSTLVLRPDQQSTYREIIKRYAVITRDLHKAGLTIDQKEVKMREIDLQRDAEVKVLLTPEQFKDYLHDKEERAKRSVGLQKKQHPLGTK
ncbi:MAG: hypothetical protein JST78_07770 [Bacteroidetes bacterium]|nr:hypothetical protein [Bacteroidota bacterium]